jgi:hypothetical protein
VGIETKDITNTRSPREGVSSGVISEALAHAMKEAGIDKISYFAPVYGGAVSVRIFSDEENSHPDMARLPRSKSPSDIAAELMLLSLRNEARHPPADNSSDGRRMAKGWKVEVGDISVGGRMLPVIMATATRV